MDTELREFLVRGVNAIERLAQDPVIEFETAPPVCPHCEKVDPFVRVSEKDAQGNLAGFVIQCHCLNCNKVFYAVPLQFKCLVDLDQVRQLNEERAEYNGVNR